MIEKKNPKAEINKRLRADRSTPHPSTGKIPAEILFNRRFHNRLPSIINTPSDRKDIEEARLHEIAMKKKQKDYKDKKAYVKPHNIQEGDTVLLQQKKSKQNPPFDPKHYRADYKDFLHVGSIYRRVAVDAGTIRRIFRGPSDNVGNYKKNVGSSVNQKGGINPLI